MRDDRPPEERVDRGDEPDADAATTHEPPRSGPEVHALVAAVGAEEYPGVFPGEPLS